MEGTTMVRRAVADDVPRLHALIRELAEFEREPAAVVATEDDLHDALFGDASCLFAHVAQDAGGSVVGAALWFVSYSTWTGRRGIKLEDLVVTAAARGQGHGRALLAELAGLCLERNWTRVDWHVLDWNTRAQDVYRAAGAAPMPEWLPWRLAGEARFRAVVGTPD
jgi:GNAT superfamily N-acetyltransferase